MTDEKAREVAVALSHIRVSRFGADANNFKIIVFLTHDSAIIVYTRPVLINKTIS
jgi:hypothetical protein